MPEFEIGLRVVNPNREALRLAGLSYTIDLDGREIIKGVSNELPVIEGYGSGDIMVTAAPDVLGSVGFIMDLMQQPRDAIRYSIEAKLDIGTFMPAIRVRDEGEISLRQSR